MDRSKCNDLCKYRLFLVPSECFVRDRRGVKFYDRLVRGLTDARNPEECSEDCRRTNYCRAFAFR